jgi:hypothetical protein
MTTTNKKPINLQIKDSKRIGHTLRSENSTAKEALRWNSQGKRNTGHPRNTWRRTILSEAREKFGGRIT